MRIIGGFAKGRHLKVPPGRLIRPATDRVRESLYDILAPRIAGSRFLDLFAGTGSVGLEAMSRGAYQLVCVEANRNVVRLLQENIAMLTTIDPTLKERVTVYPTVVGRALTHFSPCTFDFIFMGPPYREEYLYRETFQQIDESNLLATDGLLIMEQSKRMGTLVRTGWEETDERVYGETKLCFYQKERA